MSTFTSNFSGRVELCIVVLGTINCIQSVKNTAPVISRSFFMWSAGWSAKLRKWQ